jgi:WD40 repeat protein
MITFVRDGAALDGPRRDDAAAVRPGPPPPPIKPAGKIVVSQEARRVEQVAFSPDGATVAVLGHRKGVTLWDVAAGGERDDFDGDLRAGHILCAVFTPDGKTLITGGADKDKGIWFWDVPQGKPKGIKQRP